MKQGRRKVSRSIGREVDQLTRWLMKKGKQAREVKEDSGGYYVVVKKYLPKKWQ